MAGFVVVSKKKPLVEKAEKVTSPQLSPTQAPNAAVPMKVRKTKLKPLAVRTSLESALQSMREVLSANTEAPPVVPQSYKYQSLSVLPSGKRKQIEALLKQEKSVSSLMKLFDCEEHVILEIYDGLTRSPNKEPLQHRVKAPAMPQEKKEDKPMTLKILKPANAGTKQSEVIDEQIIKEPEAFLPEPKKPKPRALLSHSALRDRFIKKCKKSRNGNHWHYTEWRGKIPTFAVDGKQVPIRRAAWILYRGPIPLGFEPIATCGIYNCVRPDCLHLVPEQLAKDMKRPAAELVREIKRLSSLGKDTNEIVEILGGKVDPHTVYKVEKDLGFWSVK